MPRILPSMLRARCVQISRLPSRTEWLCEAGTVPIGFVKSCFCCGMLSR